MSHLFAKLYCFSFSLNGCLSVWKDLCVCLLFFWHFSVNFLQYVSTVFVSLLPALPSSFLQGSDLCSHFTSDQNFISANFFMFQVRGSSCFKLCINSSTLPNFNFHQHFQLTNGFTPCLTWYNLDGAQMCTCLFFVCAWTFATTHAAVLLWVTSVGTTKHNYSDEHWMAQWFPEFTNLEHHELTSSHLFHIYAEIKAESVGSYKTPTSPQTLLLI